MQKGRLSVMTHAGHCFLLALIFSSAGFTVSAALTWESPLNPVFPGADPHGIVVGETVWVYPTHYRGPVHAFYAYASKDLQQWEQHGPILDFKNISWIDDDGAPRHGAWAPCITEKEGKYYFYYSVGPQNPTPSRIGVAVGDTPAGPFVDSGRPLLTGGDGFEAIDPMVFTDPKSGVSYFYAGGSAGATLRVFEFNPDMVSFAREIEVETPRRFTEGAFMHERDGVYYLSYSGGSTWNASYSVHYATAETPVGPWNYEGVILKSDKHHRGPGHHSIIRQPGKDSWFILYHRWNHQRGNGPFHATRQVAIDKLEYNDDGTIKPGVMTAGNIYLETPYEKNPPGEVVDHVPQATGMYIGSPSITVLPNGDYLAAHDFFGPESNEHECATAAVLRSSDKGKTWTELTRLQCLFWPKVFVHDGAAYIMGVTRHHGYIVIRRSTDNGETWTMPDTTETGLLTPEGEFHTAPMPVIEHDGRLWRAFENAGGGKVWGIRYMAGMMSIPLDADLLDADNWTFSNFIKGDKAWLDGDFNGWLEGNAVLTRDGKMVNILRVATTGCPEKAAIVSISDDGKTAIFDPETDFINFPGGAKKFTIRYDKESDLYWSLATIIPKKHEDVGKPGGIRNTLALTCSKDLRHWEIRSILLYHPDVKAHGFQYVDWRFEDNDIIAVSRTAYNDGIGGARNNHDANFMTFHRVKNFREMSMEDGIKIPE